MQANPDVFHSIMISILFKHYKQLMELTDKKIKGVQVTDIRETQGVSTLDRYCPELSKRIWKI